MRKRKHPSQALAHFMLTLRIKFIKKKKALEEEQKRAEEIKTEENLDNKSKNKSCSCC